MTLKLKQSAVVEFGETKNKLVISDKMPIPGNISDGFFYFRTRLGPARLPLSFFITDENKTENGTV